MVLPLTFPQVPSADGPVLAGTIERSLAPNSQILLESDGPLTQAAQEGWARLLGDVTGFGIFTNTFYKWEAVVPLGVSDSSRYILPFDNTGVLATGVAVASLSGAASIAVVIRDEAGTQIGSSTIDLSLDGHISFMLADRYPVVVGKRGTAEFQAPSGSRISVLGLRVNGPALTTVPVLGDVRTGGTLPHIVFNGGWESSVMLVNTGEAAAPATLEFFGNDGAPVSMSLVLPQTGEALTASSLTRVIPAGGLLLVKTVEVEEQPVVEGWARLTSTGKVGAAGIYRWNLFGQEAAVSLITGNAASAVLAFDNTSGLTTGLALANESVVNVSVAAIIRDDQGTLLQNANIQLPALGHTSFLLPNVYAATAGKRGTIQFLAPGGISALGLRAKGDGTLTSIPVW